MSGTLRETVVFTKKSNRTVLSDFPMPDSPVARRPRLHPIWDLVKFSKKIQLLHRALRPEERVCPDIRNTLRDSRFDQKIQPRRADTPSYPLLATDGQRRIWDLVKFSRKIQSSSKRPKLKEATSHDVRNVLRDSHFFELRVSDAGSLDLADDGGRR